MSIPNLRIGITIDVAVDESGSAAISRRWFFTNVGKDRLHLSNFFLSVKHDNGNVFVEHVKDNLGVDLKFTPTALPSGGVRSDVDFDAYISPEGTYKVELAYVDPDYCAKFENLKLWVVRTRIQDEPFDLTEAIKEENVRSFIYTIRFLDFRPKLIGLRNFLYYSKVDTANPCIGNYTRESTKGVSEISWRFNTVPSREEIRFIHLSYLLTHRDLMGPVFSLARLIPKP